MRHDTSLMQKHLANLPADVLHALTTSRTPNGATLATVILSGLLNKDSSIGAYAGDHESYDLFSPLLDPIVREYHNFDGVHGTSFDASKAHMDPGDSTGAIVSTRIRVARNLKNYPLPSLMTRKQRIEIMERAEAAFAVSFEADLEGTFHPLEGRDHATGVDFAVEHFHSTKSDRFLEAAGVTRDWPSGRGVFHNTDKTALVWVNEEDHLRISSVQKGGDVRAVFHRLARMVFALEKTLELDYHPRYGAVTSCPTNLGTGLRASVHVFLPNVSARKDFQELCAQMELSIRGARGEHSEPENGVYDISNKRRLGISEVEATLVMCRGVAKLLELDHAGS